MHRPRLIGWEDSSVYHVVSRTAGRSYLFGPAEREMFGRMLDKAARFCGIEILTWCCLSNHFHLLIRISDSESQNLRSRLRNDPQALLKHLEIIYQKSDVREISMEIEELRNEEHDAAAAAIVEKFLRRIGSLSVFIKELKQRYSIWFNSNHGRDGTLWNARFRSVLVENSAIALRTVASYIELNPVRAGIVNDPKDYRWCGYAQAMGGVSSARSGLRQILFTSDFGESEHIPKPCPVPWSQAAEEYRTLIFGKAVHIEDGVGGTVRKGITPENVAAVLNQGGKLPASQRFRLRLRHMTQGTALGSATFLEATIRNRPQQVSPQRKTSGRPIRSLDTDDFQSLRDLRADSA